MAPQFAQLERVRGTSFPLMDRRRRVRALEARLLGTAIVIPYSQK